MFDLILLTLTILLIGLLNRLKVNIGVSIFIAASAGAIFKKLPLVQIPQVFFTSLTSNDCLRMVLIVISVTFFAELLRKSGTLAEISISFNHILPPRLSVPLFSLLIGILPMPGGALVSAPLVEEGARQTSLTDVEKAVLNFWFRHVWEPISPLYPELALAASILGISIGKVISIQWPLAVGMLLSGVFFLASRIKPNGSNGQLDKQKSDYLRAINSVLPVLVIILFLLVFKNLPAYVGINAGTVFLLIRKKADWRLVRASINWKNLINFGFLMISIFFLRDVSRASGMVEGVYEYFVANNLPVPVIAFVLPFLIGLITGISSASIGISYTLMLPMLKPGGSLASAYVFIAYVGLWFSLLVTPTHLCLSMSSEYFKVRVSETYRVMAKGFVLLLAISVAWYFVLSAVY